MKIKDFLDKLPVVKAKENKEVFENIIKLLEKDCKPFLREFKKSSNMFMYRGSQKKVEVEPGILEIKPRKDRQPKDTPKEIQKKLDEFFYKKFGWKPRSEGIFVTPNVNEAEAYGINMCLVFPIGKYKYVWSKTITDLYTYLRDKDIMVSRGEIEYQWQFENSEEGKDEYIKQAIDDRDKEIKDVIFNKYIDKDLIHNVLSEVMLKCNKYYLVRGIYYNRLYNHFFG